MYVYQPKRSYPRRQWKLDPNWINFYWNLPRGKNSANLTQQNQNKKTINLRATTAHQSGHDNAHSVQQTEELLFFFVLGFSMFLLFLMIFFYFLFLACFSFVFFSPSLALLSDTLKTELPAIITRERQSRNENVDGTILTEERSKTFCARCYETKKNCLMGM